MASVEEQELWDDLHLLMEKASSAVGMAISLGQALQEEGFKAIREELTPFVQELLPNVQPRVISGYATLLWFTKKLLDNTGLSDMVEDIMTYFKEELAPEIRNLQHQQGISAVQSESPLDVTTRCVKDVINIARTTGNKDIVESFVKVDTFTHDDEQHPVLALRYENIPETAGLFSKTKLTSSVSRGRLGHANKAKTFLGERSKACLIYLSALPDEVVGDIMKVIPDARRTKLKPKKGGAKATPPDESGSNGEVSVKEVKITSKANDADVTDKEGIQAKDRENHESKESDADMISHSNTINEDKRVDVEIFEEAENCLGLDTETIVVQEDEFIYNKGAIIDDTNVHEEKRVDEVKGRVFNDGVPSQSGPGVDDKGKDEIPNNAGKVPSQSGPAVDTKGRDEIPNSARKVPKPSDGERKRKPKRKFELEDNMTEYFKPLYKKRRGNTKYTK